MKRIRVFLADDHVVVREGLRALLASAPDMEVVGEAGDGWEAVKLIRERLPEVVIMDVAMPSLNGLGAMREILKQAPGTRVLVLTSYGDEDCVRQMVVAGAAGFLRKQTAGTELLAAIHEIHRGRTSFSPEIAKQLRASDDAGLSGRKAGQLTAREVEVLRVITMGCSNKEAAAKLGISIKTIEKHRQQVMNKLNIHEVAGLTRYALSRGLIDRHAESKS